jgi:hypothetical protein
MIEVEGRPTEIDARVAVGASKVPRLPQIIAPFLRPETIIFLLIWTALMMAGSSQMFRDPGSLWHPVVGQKILDSSSLIYTDSFSFTRAGEPWIAQWWLAECLLAGLHQLGGLDTILLATACVLAGLYTWMAHRLIVAGLHPLLAALVTALTCLASSYHFHPRPHIATIVFMGVVFAFLCDFEAGRISLRKLFWLIPLFVVWTNMHGGMVGGVATMALAVFGWSMFWVLGLESPIKSGRQIFVLISLVLGCAVTALVNPYGLELPRAWFPLMRSPYLPILIAEHGPLMSSYVGYTVLLFALFYVVALLGVLPKVPRITWLLPIVWFFLAWTRVRHGPLFAITAGIALADMVPYIRWMGWLARHGSETCVLHPKVSFASLSSRLRGAILPIAVVGLSLFLQLSSISFPLLGAGRAKPDREDLPIDLLQDLREIANTSPPGTPIFNEMGFSGLLIYYTPEFRVFIDDRCELYGDEGLVEYAQAYFEDPAHLDRWQKQYGFRLALVATGSNFDSYLQTDPAWELVRKTALAALYRRNHS